jgi:O-antigen/teichoic acid export membrane protein
MLTSLVNRVKGSKALFAYFFLTYLDKILSFALPLSILFLLNSKSLYTFIEVVYSYATLVMVVIELGVSNYLFYGYKHAANKEEFTHKAKIFFKFLLLFYGLCSLPIALAIKYIDPQLLSFFALICVRSLFTFYVNFYSNIYRLNDNPSGIYRTTLIINICSFLLLITTEWFHLEHQLFYFILPSLAWIVGVSTKFILTELRELKLSEFFSFLGDAFKFSWPIILNVLAMSYMNNYAKIYAYGYLSQEETLEVSYIMRVGLIIQLTHTSIASFFSKALFMEEKKHLNFNIFKKYTFFIALASVSVVLLVILTNLLFSDKIHISLSASTFLFILYIILWCFTGYLEIYFGILNANRRVLYYSVVSALTYTLLLNVWGPIDLFKLSVCMVISAILNLSLVILGLSKLRVIEAQPGS